MKRKCGFREQIYHQEELKIHLNLSWFKLYTISPKKRQFILVDTYSPWKDTATNLKGYLGLNTRLKTSSLDFPFSWLVFLSLVSKIIQFLFYFHVLHVIFIKIMAKKGINFFSTGNPPWYIIIAISLSRLVLVIGFNNNSINTVSFSIYFPFYVIFIKKWQKTSDCNFQHRTPIMEGCWRTSASGCCKSWRGSCGHRS